METKIQKVRAVVSQLNLFQKKAKKADPKMSADVRKRATALMAEIINAVQKCEKGALRDGKSKNNK